MHYGKLQTDTGHAGRVSGKPSGKPRETGWLAEHSAASSEARTWLPIRIAGAGARTDGERMTESIRAS